MTFLLVKPIAMRGQIHTRDILHEPFIAFEGMSSLVRIIFTSISQAPVGVLENAES